MRVHARLPQSSRSKFRRDAYIGSKLANDSSEAPIVSSRALTPFLLLATARKPQSPPKLQSVPQPNDDYGFGCTAIPKIVQSTTNICYLRGQFHALDLMAVIG